MVDAVVPVAGLFFFNDTATTEIYTLSLHDALPISNEVDSQLAAQINRMEEQNQLSKEANAILNKIRLQQPTAEVNKPPYLTSEHLPTLRRIGVDFNDPNGDGNSGDSLYYTSHVVMI